eukprot:426638_1
MDNNKFNGPFCICSSRLPLWKQLEQYVNSPNDIALINCQQQFPELTSWFLEIVEGFSWTLLVETANKFIKNISGQAAQSETSMNNESFNRRNRSKCLFHKATTIHKYYAGQIDELSECVSSLSNSNESCCFPSMDQSKMSMYMRKVRKKKEHVRKQNSAKYCKNKQCDFDQNASELNETQESYVPVQTEKKKKRKNDDMINSNVGNTHGIKRRKKNKKKTSTKKMDISKDDIKCIDEYDYQNVTDNDTMSDYSENDYDCDEESDYSVSDMDINVPPRQLMHINILDKSKEEKELFMNDISSATEDSTYERANKRGQLYNGPDNPYLQYSSYEDEGANTYSYNVTFNKRRSNK